MRKEQEKIQGHTPGPWDATTRRGSWDWVVFQASNPNIEICQPFHDDTEMNELGEANAHLIAAAPDLLAVLKRYVGAYPAFRMKPIGAEGSPARIEQEGLMALEDAARAAIAKARGEKP